MANIATSNDTTKLFSVEVLLNPPARPGHPYALPSVLVIGIAYKHNHLTHTGTEYTYDIIRLQAQGLPNGRNFLNELRAPLLSHFDALFYNEPVQEKPFHNHLPRVIEPPPIPDYPLGGHDSHQGPELAPMPNFPEGGRKPYTLSMVDEPIISVLDTKLHPDLTVFDDMCKAKQEKTLKSLQMFARGHAKDYRNHYGEYLRSEDYQYDRGEERREKENDPSNNL